MQNIALGPIRPMIAITTGTKRLRRGTRTMVILDARS
jgi:hypothetical protein